MLVKMLPSLIFGGGLLVLGLWMMSMHRRYARVNIKLSPTAEERAEQRYVRRRFLRRMQISGMIAIVGMMIPGADAAVILLQPLIATVLLMLILALVGWIVLLTFGDIYESRGFSARSQAKIKQLKRHHEELQDELDRHIRNREQNKASS
ncbi:hypothetical protein [Lacunimicrobium album]